MAALRYANLGDIVSVLMYGEATIAGISRPRRQVLLAWGKEDIPYRGGWSIDKRDQIMEREGCVYLENIDDYTIGYWVGDNTEYVKVVRINIPDQKCVGCNRDAPHLEPNLPDNKFICVSCKAEKIIDTPVPTYAATIANDSPGLANSEAFKERIRKALKLRMDQERKIRYKNYYQDDNAWDRYNYYSGNNYGDYDF